MFQLHQLELEHRARQHRLVNTAFRARLRNRKAAREARTLHRVSDAVGQADSQPREARSPVRAVR